MKILYVVASLDPSDGGAVHVVRELTPVLAKKGADITIFAPSRKDKEVRTVHYGDVKTVFFPTGFFAKYWPGYSRPLAETLKREASRFDLIHTHGIWYYPQFAVYLATKGSTKPIVASVHGELSDINLSRSALKKKIFSAIAQRKILKIASAIHAVSEKEAEDIFRFVGKQHIASIPNGVNPEGHTDALHSKWINNKFPEIDGKKVILYLGRISSGKGIDTLVKAFAHIAKDKDNVLLLIAGPDSLGYRTHIEKIIEMENVSDTVIFTGMLEGTEKKTMLDCADVFVLPSLSEGFSIAVLEAMLCGLPVIISHQCNFNEVDIANAGKVISVDIDSLANAMTELLNNPVESKEMGKRGATLVREKYTWDVIADKMLALYNEIVTNQQTS